MSSVDILADIEKHADKILQVCSYHRRDFDLVVIRSRPHEMHPVQASLQSAFQTLPTADLRILDCLPTELLLLILQKLDIRSYFNFRKVNRQARIISTSLWEYNLVSRHGLEGLRGLLRAELGPYFTINHLYRTLITDKCSTCGAFGGHLFLFTAERCCFDCLLSSTNYRVLSRFTFTRFARLYQNRFHHLSRQMLRTVPGIYSMLEKRARRPGHLIFAEKATQTLLDIGVIGDDAVRKLGSCGDQEELRFMSATAYPYYSLEDAKLEPGVSCKGCQIQHGLLYNTFIDRDRVFSTRGFLSHFSQCIGAQDLWIASERGTQPINEPQIIRSCGYFNELGPDGLPA
ncbi:hypothetical protein GGR51DRAFT_512228 [Nemania sp. FL0031]|nr:hypothetical protein GGR51DRAFT_512228 [Nemania sp. FL0031]